MGGSLSNCASGLEMMLPYGRGMSDTEISTFREEINDTVSKEKTAHEARITSIENELADARMKLLRLRKTVKGRPNPLHRAKALALLKQVAAAEKELLEINQTILAVRQFGNTMQKMITHEATAKSFISLNKKASVILARAHGSHDISKMTKEMERVHDSVENRSDMLEDIHADIDVMFDVSEDAIDEMFARDARMKDSEFEEEVEFYFSGTAHASETGTMRLHEPHEMEHKKDDDPPHTSNHGNPPAPTALTTDAATRKKKTPPLSLAVHKPQEIEEAYS